MDMGKYRSRYDRVTSPVRHLNQWRFLMSLLIALFLLFGIQLLGPAAQQNVAHAASANPIVVENQQPGTTSWQFDNFNKEARHEIEGYASLTSVNKGSPLSFMVSLSTNAQYTMDIYRMGYYAHGTNPDGSACSGCGGRLMQSVGPLNGITQAACLPYHLLRRKFWHDRMPMDAQLYPHHPHELDNRQLHREAQTPR